MTGGVEQALARIVIPKANPDRQPTRNGETDSAFDQALGIGAKARPTAETRKTAGDDPRWSRFGTKLDDTIKRASDLGSKMDTPSPEPDMIVDPDGLIASEDPPDLMDFDQTAKPRKIAKPDKDESRDDRIPIEIVLSKAEDGSAKYKAGEEPGAAAETDDAETQSPEPIVASAPVMIMERAIEVGRPTGGDAPLRTRIERETTRHSDEGDAVDGSSDETLAPRTAQTSDRRITQKLDVQDQQPTARPANHVRNANSGEPIETPAPKTVRPFGEQSRVNAQATILSEYSIPAPTQSTSLVLAQTLASSGALKSASGGPRIEPIGVPVGASGVHSLSIQLHPAELGMVTASLRFAGEQLTIELQVESNEAYRALVADTETVAKSLRSMGYDIERVTVLQPVTAHPAQTRADTAIANPSQFGRPGEQWGSGASGSGNTGPGSQQQEGNGGNARSGNQNGPLGNIDRPDGGVYI
jgi:chemotaxis protein MotD